MVKPRASIRPSQPAPSDKILLHGAQFFARHGVSEEERRTGGRYVVDIELTHDFAGAAATDDLTRTISYADVFVVAREVVEGRSFLLVETLGETLAQTLLERFPATTVMVRVRKQPPPIDGIVDFAGVEISRERRRKSSP